MFNSKRLLREFKHYSLQDSKCLYNALSTAQLDYIEKYNVDITSIVSIPSLAFKIFRLNYLEVNIPLLSKINDRLIRRSYFGGATDIYKCYGENLYYIDVNSLYPFAMCKPMLLNLVRSYNSISANNININKFFGFLEVDMECPDSVLRPVLTYRFKGKTIFPRGLFTGVYFSEELKAVLPIGYKILKIHSAKQFDKSDLFTGYVNQMYHTKMSSTGSQRWLAKLLLNSLYGLFGRKQEIIESVTINKSDIHKYILTNIIKTVIDIDENSILIKNIEIK